MELQAAYLAFHKQCKKQRLDQITWVTKYYSGYLKV